MPPGRNAGGSTRGPISNLAGIELLGKVVWYRSKAKITKAFKSNDPEASTSGPYAKELPQELLDMIIAHILFDTPTLKACSATCRSWYIATLPHLHHVLTLRIPFPNHKSKGLIPLQKLAKMQLLPLVKQLWIVQPGPHNDRWFQRTVFNARSLAYFSALTNVQELGIDGLDLQMLTPRGLSYFEYFAPTLRSLILRDPMCTHRQFFYFLGLFPNLDDLNLVHSFTWRLESDPVPSPQSAPSFRGRLTMRWESGEMFLRELSELSGGLRFRHLNLVEGLCVRFLLDACVETLETLRVHPMYWISNFRRTVRQVFDLSKNRSLRSLEISLKDIPQCPDLALIFLMDILSTITSPVFSDLVIIFEDKAARYVHLLYHTLFSMVRRMYEVRPFRLVFRLEIRGGDHEETARMLKECIDAQVVRGELWFLPCPPVILSSTRARHRPREGFNTRPFYVL